MISAYNSALSGMTAASAKLEAAANNIANQFSTKTVVDGKATDKPYTPQRVDVVSLSQGGVIAQTSGVNPATVQQPTTNPQSTGIEEVPNVDPAQQIVDMMIAKQAFKANLQSLKAQQEIDKYLLDIKS